MLATRSTELRVDAIEGWRAWSLRRNAEGRLVLGSAFATHEWSAGHAPAAACKRFELAHDAPVETCMCGYHALADARGLSRFDHVTVVGSVALWGRVVEHASGYRAQFAYPQRLRLVCGPCLRLGRRARPTVAVTLPGGIVRAACDRHRSHLQGDEWRTASDVEAELLGRYSVEQLPVDALPKLSRGVRAARAVRAVPRSRGPGRIALGVLLVVWLVRAAAGVVVEPTPLGVPGAAEPATASVEPATAPVEPSAAAPEPPAAAMANDREPGPEAGSPERIRLPFRLRFLCGTGAFPDILVAPCRDPAATWVSMATFRSGAEPRCQPDDVTQRLPDGRHRCWFELV